ncbi:2920_t:CDS:2, partial [Scutellospora calospora]
MTREINDNMKALRDLYKRTLITVTEDESSRMSRQIDLLISETSRISGQISHKLTDQTQMRSTQHATLAKVFMDTMTSYRNMQVENAKKYREKIIEQYHIVNPDATQEEIDNLIDNDINKLQSSAQSNQSRTILTEIQDRQHDVRRIEKSINELNEMFRDIQALVIEKEDVAHTTRFFEMTQDIPVSETPKNISQKHKRYINDIDSHNLNFNNSRYYC